eukprot:14725-Heterococcus_DN1.PRE.2
MQLQALDFAQEQHDEIQALSSIWPSEFRQKAGVWAKQEYACDVTPGLDHDNFARVTLVFSYPARYPHLPPVLRLEDAQHLSDAEVKELKALLTLQAQSLAGRGNVFMLDLIMEAQQFVRDHNRRPDRSLYDNMESEDRRQKQENDQKLDAEEARMKEEDRYAAQQQAAKERTKREQQLQQRRSSINDAGGTDEQVAAAAAEDAVHASSSEFDSNDSTDNEERRNSGVDGDAGGRSSWYRSQFKEWASVSLAAESHLMVTLHVKQQICQIGRGGFGTVYKVRNRVDKRLYAIKKIPLDPHDKETNKKIRREVTTISRMIHK